MHKRRLITIIIIMFLWQFAALVINNDILIPMPYVVFVKMINDIVMPSFYLALYTTIIRLLIGLLVAITAALCLGLLSGLKPVFAEYFSVIDDIIKTIPNISYIIIILIWLNAEQSVTVITFFIIFPNLYANVLLGVKSLPRELKDVLFIYPLSLNQKIFKVYLPQVLPYLLTGIKVAFGLGLKVSVMAEILTQVRFGIGKQLLFARNTLDMTAIFAWTIWIIMISLIIDQLFELIIRKTKNNR